MTPNLHGTATRPHAEEENTMSSHNEQVSQLVADWKEGRVDRREFIARAMAIGFSFGMAGALMRTTDVAAAGGSFGAKKGVDFVQSEPVKGGQAIIGLSQEPTLFNPVLSNLEVD